MAEYDWAELTGRAVERLRKPKVTPVPDAIVRAAQRSYDQKAVLEHTFQTSEQAESFAKLIRKAGLLTEPNTTTRVVIDPEETGDLTIVRWSTGARRGHG